MDSDSNSSDNLDPIGDAPDEDGLYRPKLHSTYSSSDGQYSSLAAFGVGLISSLGETVLSHPCIVIRRQCQVRHDSHWYHLTPFSLLPVVYQIQRNQGLSCMWKGVGSVFIVRGIGLVSETVISDMSPLPKEVNRHSSVKKMAQHLLLKSLSWVIMTPFYAASLVETVQSDVASERPGLTDCLREGVGRLLRLGSATPASSRLLSVHRFIIPTVVLGVSGFVLRGLAQYAMLSVLRNEEEEDELPINSGEDTSVVIQQLYRRYYPELLAAFGGGLLSDLVLFPLETLVHRLVLQGTRTIVDDLDTGSAVAPATAAYDGLFDALRCTVSEEGISGLYKGFGALCLQYALHLALLKSTKAAFEFLLNAYSPPAPPPPPPPPPSVYEPGRYMPASYRQSGVTGLGDHSRARSTSRQNR